MFSTEFVFDRLVELAGISLFLLIPGSVATLCCREPIRRLRIIVLTLAGCVAAPLVSLVPHLPRWSPPVELVASAASSPDASEPGSRPRETSAQGFDAMEAELPQSSSPETDQIVLREKEESAPPIAHADYDASEAVEAHLPIEAVTTVATAERSSVEPPLVGVESTGPQVAGHSLDTFTYDAPTLVVAAYAAGLMALTAWWLVGFAGLLRILRSARPAPEACRARLREIAGPAGDRVRLLVSGRVRQPFTFAWGRPVIVLPEAMCADEADPLAGGSTAEQRASAGVAVPSPSLTLALAHEWSHVARGDTWTWSFAGFVRLIYFWQPLAWWLRAELRLCQDYLADADAARLSSPTDYAEFLATRAVGRPLAVGLGITAGKSDLYRRVAMLVQHRRSLETRCPRWWTAGVVSSAMGLVLLAATFGERAESRGEIGDRGPGNGDRERPSAFSQASSDERGDLEMSDASPARDRPLLAATAPANFLLPTGADEDPAPLPTKTTDSRSARGAATAVADDTEQRKLDVGTIPQAEKQLLIDRLIARQEALRSGRVTYSSKLLGRGQREFVFSGESWKSSRIQGVTERMELLNHGGHLLILLRRMSKENPEEAVESRLTVNWPIKSHPGQFGSCDSDTLAFLRNHSDQVRYVGQETIGGQETEVIEFPMRETRLVIANGALKSESSSGGTTRLWLAPRLGYAVFRERQADRFGLPVTVLEYSEFEEVVPGLFFPRVAITRAAVRTDETRVTSIADINQPIPASEFVLRIPQRTAIEDLRPHRFDNTRGPGYGPAYDSKKYPLRMFTNWAEDLQGLPPTVLAEMDRDVLSREQWERKEGHAYVSPGDDPFDQPASPAETATSGRSPASSPASSGGAPTRSPVRTPATDSGTKKTTTATATDFQRPTETPSNTLSARSATPEATTKSSLPAVAKADLRYGGKSFDEWQVVLLRDLDPESRVKALEAIGTLGDNGYATEAVAAVDQVLTGDSTDAGTAKVQQAAINALARLGAAGVPVLEAQLDRKSLRNGALAVLNALAAKTDAVVPALLKVGREGEPGERSQALGALARHRPNAAGASEVWLWAIANDESDQVRADVMQALAQSQDGLAERPAPLLPLLLKSLTSDSGQVRIAAATLLTLHAPTQEGIAERVREAIVACDLSYRQSFVRNQNIYRRRLNPAVTIPVLVALLEAEVSHSDQSFQDTITVLMRIRADGKAQSVVPALVAVAHQERPWAWRLLAVDALGDLGAEARGAAPALQRLLELPAPRGQEAVSSNGRFVSDWRGRIQAAIRKILDAKAAKE